MIDTFPMFSRHNNFGPFIFLIGMLAVKGLFTFRKNNVTPHGRNFVKMTGGLKIIDSMNLSVDEENRIINAHQSSLELYNKFRSFKDGYIANHLNSALDVLYDALRLYGPKQLFSSFNGGKDAVVIMHLLRAATAKYSQDTGAIHRPQFVYFAIKDEFPEVIEHINECEELYCLDLVRYDSGISQGLVEHIKKLAPSSTPAFILGTRKSDPNCGEQQTWAPSSWNPPFMRVNPILSWEYGHVWHFLRTFNLPYCNLYDLGFTSLGRTTDTRPNPALLRKPLNQGLVSNEGSSKILGIAATPMTPKNSNYWPAYMLADWSLERAGRGQPVSLAEDCSNTSIHSQVATELVNKTTTAGLIIIGDEILNALTTDVNLQAASKALGSIGIPLLKVAIVLDDIDEIVDEVRRMSQKYDVVITSGGIGPTHDDVTIKAVGRALGQGIKMNEVMLNHLRRVSASSSTTAGSAKTPRENLIESQSGLALSEEMKRLALLPEHCQLLFPPRESNPQTPSSSSRLAFGKSSATAGSSIVPQHSPTNSISTNSSVGVSTRNTSEQQIAPEWPILKCENIFVLPGIPQFFEKKINTIVRNFLSSQPSKKTKKIILDVEERSIVSLLDKLVAVCPDVKFGSYPFVEHPEFKTIITVEGLDSSCVDDAVSRLVKGLPADAVLRVERVDSEYAIKTDYL